MMQQGDDQERIRQNVAKMRAQKATDAEVEHYLSKVEGLAPKGSSDFEGDKHSGAGADWTDGPGEVASAMSGAVDMSSMGFADEIGSFAPAVANLLFGDTEGFKKALANRSGLRKQLVARDQEAKEANPKSYFAGEMAAGVASAPKALAKMGIVKGGAAMGAAMGAGHAEGDMSDRAVGAGVGGLAGAVGGAAAEKVVAPAVGYVASKAAPYIGAAVEKAAPHVRDLAARAQAALEERGVGLSTRDVSGASLPPNASRGRSLLASAAGKVRETADAFAPLTSRERAQQVLLKNIGRDETSVGNLIADAQALPANSPMAIVDLADEGVMGVARGARAVPSTAKKQVPKALTDRLKGEHGRTRSAIEGAAGTKPGDPELVTKDLVDRTRANAKPVYDVAYADEPIDDVVALKILADPAAPAIYKSAARQAAREKPPVKLPPLEDVLSGKAAMPVQGFDLFKRGMDDYIESKMGAGKLGRNEARQLRDAMRESLDRVDEVRPNFKAARAQFAGDKEMEAAAEAGKEFLTTDDRKVARLVKDYTPGEREVYAQMALDAIDKTLRSTGDTHDVYNRIFGNQLKRDALKALVGDDAFQQLAATMEGVQRRTRTHRFVTGGSNSVDKLGEQLDLETPGIPTALLQLIKGNPGQAAQSLGTSVLMNRMKGITGETAGELGQMTTAGMQGGEAGRASLIDILSELSQAEQRELQRKLTRQGIAPITQPFSGMAGGATAPRRER